MLKGYKISYTSRDKSIDDPIINREIVIFVPDDYCSFAMESLSSCAPFYEKHSGDLPWGPDLSDILNGVEDMALQNFTEGDLVKSITPISIEELKNQLQ
jgi:hypothetical protein